MGKRMCRTVLLGMIAGIIWGAGETAGGAGEADVHPVALRCEMLENPAGVTERAPRLSWRFSSDPADKGSWIQTTYRIRVGTSKAGVLKGADLVWDSDWVNSAAHAGIPYGGQALSPDRIYYWTVDVKDQTGRMSASDEVGQWITGLATLADWDAEWIGTGESFCQVKDEERPFDPWFRKSFTLDAPPKQAFLHIASVGYHEVYVNGEKVDDTVLAPCVTDNKYRARSVTYVVTPFLTSGKNTIGIWLGPGWSVFHSFWRKDLPFVGPIFKLHCDARLENGKTVKIRSGKEWKTAPSCSKLLGRWNFAHFGGELVDGRVDASQWNLATFEDSTWEKAVVCNPDLKITPQMVEPNRPLTEVRPKVIEKLGDGKWRVDMGRNFSGWTEVTVRGKPGDLVQFSYSELKGQPMTFNLASQCKIGPSGITVFRNRFNYSSGRWVTISGLRDEPRLEDIRGWLIRTDYQRASAFRCSDDLLNWIYDTTLWTFENLTLGGYTVDCPQRERMGYGGDAHGTCESGMYNYRLEAFYSKWMEDWRDVQGFVPDWLKDGTKGIPGGRDAAVRGNLPNTAPTYDGGGGPCWGGIVISLPWWYYQQYGDRKVLEENFGLMERWLGFLNAYVKDGLLTRYGAKWSFLGDWLWPGAVGTPNSETPEALCLNNMYRIYNLRTAAKIAQVIGRNDQMREWNELADRGARAVHAKYFNAADSSYLDGSMAILGAALLAEIPPAELRRQVIKRLETEILVNKKGHVGCGITGGALLFHWLRQEERTDLVYAMATKTDYPGWGNMRAKGGDYPLGGMGAYARAGIFAAA